MSCSILRTTCTCVLAACLVWRPAAAEGKRMLPQRDYSKLGLKGNGMAQDSFCLAVQAAAKLLRREADYETIACLSANAFAPAIDLGEDCTSWWHCQAWQSVRALPIVAECLGLRARRLVVPQFAGTAREERAAYLQRAAAEMRQAMGAGEVILTDGGWEVKGPHGFVPWCWAGILTEAREDGTILAAALDGHKDNPIAWPAGMWALSTGEATLGGHRADRAMLRVAVARVRGKAPFQRAGRGVYGVDAMDAWIRQMETVPGFCKGCQDRSQKGWTDARGLSQASSAGLLQARGEAPGGRRTGVRRCLGGVGGVHSGARQVRRA